MDVPEGFATNQPYLLRIKNGGETRGQIHPR